MPSQLAILAISILAILIAGCTNTDPEKSVVAMRLDTAIIQLKSIPTPSSPSPAMDTAISSIPDQIAVRQALRKGDIAPLKAYLPEIARRFDNGELSEATFEEALRALRATLPEAIPALDAWVTESPRENAARLARGIVRTELAWYARGSDSYRYIPKEDIRKMYEWFGLAADDLVVSIGLSRRPTSATGELIGIARVAGGLRKKAKALFAEGIRIAPTSFDLYNQFAAMMYMEWGGGPIAEAEALVAVAAKLILS